MATSKSWKAEERIFAAALGGKRQANNGQRQADIIAGDLRVEHKKTARLPALFRLAWSQALAGAAAGTIPVVAVSATTRGKPTQRYVMLRLEDFVRLYDEAREWR